MYVAKRIRARTIASASGTEALVGQPLGQRDVTELPGPEAGEEPEQPDQLGPGAGIQRTGPEQGGRTGGQGVEATPGQGPVPGEWRGGPVGGDAQGSQDGHAHPTAVEGVRPHVEGESVPLVGAGPPSRSVGLEHRDPGP